MRVSGFVMTDESGEVLAVSVGGSGDLVKSLAAGKVAPGSPAELAAEHERLVDVLRSPDHNDDLAEADRQEGELAEYRDQAGEEMSKAHVKGYTRKDGTFVKEHDDKRQAAQPEQPSMRPLSNPKVNAISDKHGEKFNRKESEWQHDGEKIPASDLSGVPEFSHKEVYGNDGNSSPAGTNFSPNFAKQGHRAFVLKHPDGKRSYVDNEGFPYARYHAPVEDAPAGGGERVNSDDAFEQITAAGGKDATTTSGHINYTHNGQQKQLAHKDAADGHRYVDSGELEQHLSDMKGGAGNEADDPRVILGAMSAPKLKAAINAAVSKFGIHDSWSAPKTNDKEVLIDHIDSLCNEHHLRVMDDGSLTKAGAGASSSGGGASYDHPNAVGKADFGSETPEKGWSMKFAGTDYTHTGKEGKSAHDDTPVREFESEDGHRVWADGAGRVHADSKDEVAGLRQKYEASVAPKAEKKAAPKKAAAGGSDAGVPGKPMAKSLLFVHIGGADELLSMAKSVIGPGSGD